MEAVITSVLEGVFFVVFAVVVLRYLRRPSPLDRDVLLVFGSVAGLFALGIIGRLVPDMAALRTGAAVLLVAQPYLTIRLIRHFTPLPMVVDVAVLVAFLVAAGWVVGGITGDPAGLAYVVGYFVTVNTVSGLAFFRAAGSRVGAARMRLALAGVATILFGTSILIAGAGSAAEGATDGATAATSAARVVALLAGVGYLLAFAPPRWLRRIQRQATAFELDQELLALEPGSGVAVMWQSLAGAARRATGARAAAVIAAGPEGVLLAEDGTWEERPVVGSRLGRVSDGVVSRGPTVVEGLAAGSLADDPVSGLARAARADTAILVPLAGSSGPRGTLAIIVAGSALFVDDDLAVLRSLASRTIAAIEHQEALEERSALVGSLRRTNEELARASAAKSDFLAAMSHELRTPLNSIIGFSELLMMPVRAGDGRRGLDVVDQAGHIHSAGLQLLDLVNEVLDLARIEAGRLELRYDRFDLVGLVRRTVGSMTPLADQRSVGVEVQARDGIEVEADPNRIRQVVYNLLSNAIKFSPEQGIIRVQVAVEDETASVSIVDEGPGIPPAEQAQVFEAFAQGQHGRLRSEGAGLGLALSRQLAEAHGGRIELMSDPPRGSTFTLRLPVRRPDTIANATVRDGRRLVLVVEDDPAMVALLRSWLEAEGYAVSTAATGHEGLELTRTLAPDAVLLDIVLPDIDGWDVLQQLRLERRTRDIPILVASVVDDQQLGLALGAADYLVKPIDRQVLLDRLAWLTRTRTSSDPAVVLAIDADGSAQAAYRSILDGTARLIEARSAESARRLARQARADIILLDLGLRDASPFGLLAELRDHPATRDTPVLAITAVPLSDEEKTRLTGQVTAIFEKRDAAEGLAAWLREIPGPRRADRPAAPVAT